MAQDRANDPRRKYTPPKEGDWYTTHSSGVSGRIEEVVPNKTGTSRVRLKLNDGSDNCTSIKDLETDRYVAIYKERALDRLERQERLEGAIPAEFGGESASNIRTGRRGESVLSATVDYRVQEAQATFEQSLLAEDKIAIAIERTYWGDQKKTFYLGGRSARGQESYVPNKIWESDFHYVAYSAAGSDVNSLIIGLGQRLGTGLMSKESAREADPLISDPDLEHDRIIAEGVESALMSSIQQQASMPDGPYQPEDLAYLTKLVLQDDVPLYEAVRRTDQRAKDRQAAMAPAGAPETMPGLAMPGMGAEMQAGPPPGAGGAPPLDALLAQLGGGM